MSRAFECFCILYANTNRIYPYEIENINLFAVSKYIGYTIIRKMCPSPMLP